MEWTPATIAAVAGTAITVIAAVTKLGQWLFDDIRRQLNSARADRDAAKTATLSLERELAGLRMEHSNYRTQLAQLAEQRGRLMRAAALFTHQDTLDYCWQGALCGVVVSSSINGGSIEWVNKTFKDALGYTLDEMKALGRDLVHPDDFTQARFLEAVRWDSPILGEVIRLKRADSAGGGYVRMRWFGPPYVDGLTISRAEIVGPISDTVRVLLVEDEPILRELLQEMLAGLGMDVVAAVDSGTEAVEQALLLRPDVLLIDLRLRTGPFGGTEAIRRITQQWPAAKAIVLTSYEADSPEVAAAIAAGAVSVLAKSKVRERDLMAAVNAALKSKVAGSGKQA